jgi:hypothetical protein
MIKIRDETIMDATYVNIECIHAIDSCWLSYFLLCKVFKLYLYINYNF